MAFTKVVGAGIHTLSNITSHNIHSSGIVTATKFDGPFDNLNVTGFTTFTGGVSIGGTLTYEDVTNIDSVGLVTARDGIFIPDNKKLELGNAAGSGDLQLYSDGNDSFIKETTRDLIVESTADDVIIRAADNIVLLPQGGELGAEILGDGAVNLYWDGSKKFETTNTGAKVTGTLAGASEVGIQSGGVQIGAGITQLNFVGTGNTFAVNGTTVDISIQGGGGGTGAGGTWSSYTAGIATTKSVGVNTNNLDVTDLVGVGNSFQGLYISNGMMIMDNTLNGNHYIGTTMNGLMSGPVNIDGTLTVDGNYVVV